MPRGPDHISFVFSSAFRDIFHKVFSVISKPRYFELFFFHFPWDFEIAGFDCGKRLGRVIFRKDFWDGY